MSHCHRHYCWVCFAVAATFLFVAVKLLPVLLVALGVLLLVAVWQRIAAGRAHRAHTRFMPGCGLCQRRLAVLRARVDLSRRRAEQAQRDEFDRAEWERLDR